MSLITSDNFELAEELEQSEAYKLLFGRSSQELKVPFFNRTLKKSKNNEVEMNRDYATVSMLHIQENSESENFQISNEYDFNDNFSTPSLKISKIRVDEQDLARLDDCAKLDQPWILLTVDKEERFEEQHNHPFMNRIVNPPKPVWTSQNQLPKSKKNLRKDSCLKSQGETFYSEQVAKDNEESKEQESKDEAIILDQSFNNISQPRYQFSEWNSFSLRRACFRGMSAFYKGKFEGIYKSWMKSRYSHNAPSMKTQVLKFIKEQFISSNCVPQIVKSNQFYEWVSAVLHSHRHKKSEEYIKNWDFSKIRNVLYSFSSSAKRSFLTDKNYAAIFVHFYDMEGKKFISSRSQRKSTEYKMELQSELGSLYSLAIETINQS